MTQTRSVHPDAATLRRLAVEASADPRSVRQRLLGRPVRGMAAHRIDEVLARHGITPGAEPTSQADTAA